MYLSRLSCEGKPPEVLEQFHDSIGGTFCLIKCLLPEGKRSTINGVNPSPPRTVQLYLYNRIRRLCVS